MGHAEMHILRGLTERVTRLTTTCAPARVTRDTGRLGANSDSKRQPFTCQPFVMQKLISTTQQQSLPFPSSLVRKGVFCLHGRLYASPEAGIGFLNSDQAETASPLPPPARRLPPHHVRLPSPAAACRRATGPCKSPKAKRFDSMSRYRESVPR